MSQKQRRVNEAITEQQIRIISETGEPIGLLSRDEALRIAEEQELDIVEIGSQDGYVLAKLMDYGKFLFKQQKTSSQNRNSSKKADVKTVKITYKIEDHDIEIRRNQALKFGQAGHPVKVMLQLRGRENQFESLGQQKVKDFVASLDAAFKLDGVKVAKVGNSFNVLLYPKK